VTSPHPQSFSRTQSHSSKLKDPATWEKFSDALEDQATTAHSVIRALKHSLQQSTVIPTQYAENVNTIIVSALQVTAHEILGTAAFRGKNAQNEYMAQRGHQDNRQYFSNDKRIAA